MDASPTERPAVPNSLSFFASQTAPIETNSIWFGPDGMPAHRDFKSPVAFSFACGGATLKARAGREGNEAWLEVEGDLGALPFSAESRDARSAVIAILLAAKLTDHRYFGIGPDQRIRLHGEIALTCPLTPASILTGLTQFTLAVRPFIELLSEAQPARPAA